MPLLATEIFLKLDEGVAGPCAHALEVARRGPRFELELSCYEVISNVSAAVNDLVSYSRRVRKLRSVGPAEENVGVSKAAGRLQASPQPPGLSVVLGPLLIKLIPSESSDLGKLTLGSARKGTRGGYRAGLFKQEVFSLATQICRMPTEH